MITQYEAVAEIEAMKARRHRSRTSSVPSSAPRVSSWSSATEAQIRREMERRLASRVRPDVPEGRTDGGRPGESQPAHS